MMAARRSSDAGCSCVVLFRGDGACAERRPAQNPTDIKPGSITYDDIEYPYPVAYLPLTIYGQDVRMACLHGCAASRAAQRPHGDAVSWHELWRILLAGPIAILR